MVRSQRAAVDDDDMSPHLNTLTSKSELTGSARMKFKGDVDCGPEDSASIIESQTHRGDKDAQDQRSADMAESEELQDLVGTSRYDESPEYLPAHLYESTEPGEEKSSKPPLSLSARPQGEGVEVQPAAKSYDTARDGQDGQVTPTGYIHREIPSSSIPHLLSTSNSKSVSADAAQLIKVQLMFDSVLTPTVRSRDGSFAFPVDEDDSVFRKNSASPQVISAACPQAHLTMNTKQGATHLEGCLSNFSSSISLASYTSPSHIIQVNTTPPCPPNFAATPPDTVPVPADTQGLQIGVNLPQLPLHFNHEQGTSFCCCVRARRCR